MSLYDQISGTWTQRGTKAEVIDYYKDTHGDKWRRAIAHDLYGTVKNKKGENMSVANIARRFEGDRGLKAAKTKGVKEQFKQLGESLPLKKPGSYHITGTMKVVYSDGSEWDATIDETITGEDADALSEMSPEDMAQGIANYYQTEDVNGDGPGWLSEELTVS